MLTSRCAGALWLKLQVSTVHHRPWRRPRAERAKCLAIWSRLGMMLPRPLSRARQKISPEVAAAASSAARAHAIVTAVLRPMTPHMKSLRMYFGGGGDGACLACRRLRSLKGRFWGEWVAQSRKPAWAHEFIRLMPTVWRFDQGGYLFESRDDCNGPIGKSSCLLASEGYRVLDWDVGNVVF